MKVTPFNLLFAVLLGYFAINLLDIKVASSGNSSYSFSFWHPALLIAIIVSDIILRALIVDAKRLWLIESLCVFIVAGVIQFLL